MRLSWRGANSPTVNIYRNDHILAQAPNNVGTYTDVLTLHGLYTYKVCEVHTMNCSNERTIRFINQ